MLPDLHKDFSRRIVNKAKIDVFVELSCFFHDPADVGIWSLVPLPFLNRIWTSESVHILLNISVHVLLKPDLENFEYYFTSVWDECNCAVVWAFWALSFFWIGMKTDLFQSCGHCWVFQICWHIYCSTLTASSSVGQNSWNFLGFQGDQTNLS